MHTCAGDHPWQALGQPPGLLAGCRALAIPSIMNLATDSSSFEYINLHISMNFWANYTCNNLEFRACGYHLAIALYLHINPVRWYVIAGLWSPMLEIYFQCPWYTCCWQLPYNPVIWWLYISTYIFSTCNSYYDLSSSTIQQDYLHALVYCGLCWWWPLL